MVGIEEKCDLDYIKRYYPQRKLTNAYKSHHNTLGFKAKYFL